MTITTKPILKTCANGARVFNPSCHARLGRVKNPCSIRRCLFYAAILGAVLCHAQTNVVYYGANSNALNVIFADTTLSVTNQSLIVADLNLCLQTKWGKETKLNTDPPEDPAFVAYLSYPDINPHGIRNFPRYLVATPNGLALHVPQQHSDFYTNRLAFAAAHSNAVAAAYEFVAFVSSPDFLNIPHNDMPHYFLSKTSSDAKLIADAPRLLPRLASPNLFPPSILGFGYLEIGPGPASSNLFMRIPFLIDDGYDSWHGVSAIWHDEKWKFMDMNWFRD